MSNLKVIRISGDQALEEGIPKDAQFLCGFPDYEEYTVEEKEGDVTVRRVINRPSGRHTLYFTLRPSIDPTGFVNAMRDANKRDTESFDTESRDLLRQLTDGI